MSNKKLNDSGKLRMCYGIIWLVISCILLAAFVCFIWLTVLVHDAFVILGGFSVCIFVCTIISSVEKLIQAGNHIE